MAKKKKKQADAAQGAEPAPAGISVAGHPRTARLVRRAKGWGGVAGVVLATLLATRAGVPALEAMLRGLAGGILGYLALWAIAVAVGRQLVIAEIRVRYAELERAAAAAAGGAEA